jgi:hypothetical protein
MEGLLLLTTEAGQGAWLLMVSPETAIAVNRNERSPAEPEIRNLKLETRNKPELGGMG